MTDHAMTPATITEAAHSNWGWFLALGIVFIIAGAFAFLAPFVASLIVTAIIGAALLLTGVVQVIQAWRVQSWRGFLWQLLIGLIILAGGIAIYWNPFVGTLTLTIFVAAMFVAKGVFQLALGFRLRPRDGWGWIIAAGIVAILVGLMIFFNFPFSGVYALGMLCGISLMFTGWSYIALAIAARRLA